MAKRTVELDVEIDERFQNAEWLAQRIGWTVWSLIMLAACVGLLGPGWFSSREETSPDGAITVGYERFLHYHNPSQIVVTCKGAPLDANEFGIRVQRSLLDCMQIRRIEPEPEHNQLTAGGIVYRFRRDQQADVINIVFHVEYERYGNVEGQIALAGGEPVTVRQFVYP